MKKLHGGSFLVGVVITLLVVGLSSWVTSPDFVYQKKLIGESIHSGAKDVSNLSRKSFSPDCPGLTLDDFFNPDELKRIKHDMLYVGFDSFGYLTEIEIRIKKK